METFRTDHRGDWYIITPIDQLPQMFTINILPGGIDIATNRIVNTTYYNTISKQYSLDNSGEFINISPLTTLKSNIILDTLTPLSVFSDIIHEAKLLLCTALEVNYNDIDNDFIYEKNINVAKTTIKITTIIESLKILLINEITLTNDVVLSAIARTIQNRGNCIYWI